MTAEQKIVELKKLLSQYDKEMKVINTKFAKGKLEIQEAFWQVGGSSTILVQKIRNVVS